MCEEFKNGLCVMCGMPRIPTVRLSKDMGAIIPNMDITRLQNQIILTPRQHGNLIVRKVFIAKHGKHVRDVLRLDE